MGESKSRVARRAGAGWEVPKADLGVLLKAGDQGGRRHTRIVLGKIHCAAR